MVYNNDLKAIPHPTSVPVPVTQPVTQPATQSVTSSVPHSVTPSPSVTYLAPQSAPHPVVSPVTNPLTQSATYSTIPVLGDIQSANSKSKITGTSPSSVPVVQPSSIPPIAQPVLSISHLKSQTQVITASLKTFPLSSESTTPKSLAQSETSVEHTSVITSITPSLAELLLDEVNRVILELNNPEEILKRVCRILFDNVAHYDWVGFYITDTERERELVLGPFVGQATEHVRIGFGQGICGQAAERREIFVVPNVSMENNYLSCSPEVKSEIVLPILKQDKLVGELDIDSHTVDAFSAQDKLFLSKLCSIVSALF